MSMHPNALFSFAVLFAEMGRRHSIAKRNVRLLESEEIMTIT